MHVIDICNCLARVRQNAFAAMQCGLALSVGCTNAWAASTDWMSRSQLKAFVKKNMGEGKAYATGIDCKSAKGGSLIKLTWVPFAGKKPFHRWIWLLEESADLAEAVANHKLTDRPELKYRIVSKRSFVRNGDGVKMTCALIYR